MLPFLDTPFFLKTLRASIIKHIASKVLPASLPPIHCVICLSQTSDPLHSVPSIPTFAYHSSYRAYPEHCLDRVSWPLPSFHI